MIAMELTNHTKLLILSYCTVPPPQVKTYFASKNHMNPGLVATIFSFHPSAERILSAFWRKFSKNDAQQQWPDY